MKSPQQSRISGYTLLELVIAAGLSTLVMAAITGLILVAYRVQSLTVQEMQTTQVAHQLLQQFTRDLQQLPAIVPVESVSETDAQSQMLAAAGDSENEIVSATTEESSAPANWFLGDNTVCEFLITQVPHPGQAVDIELGSPFDLPRQRLIRWGINSGDLENSDSSAVDRAAAESSLAVRSQYLTDSDLTEFLLEAELTAAEVQSIQFTYFDGSDWVESWDGESLQALPYAVEILLTLAAPNPNQSADESTAATTTKTIRKVIELPGSRFQNSAEVEADF